MSSLLPLIPSLLFRPLLPPLPLLPYSRELLPPFALPPKLLHMSSSLTQELMTEVEAHPLFQGPYRLSAFIGDVAVGLPRDPPPDPTGAGRKRNISVHNSGGLGSKHYEGEVTWEVGRGSILPQVPDERESRGRGMNVKTSVGAVELSF